MNIPFSKILEDKLIHEGDVLLFRGFSFSSKIIAQFTGGIHSHAAMASWSNGMIECIEFREWKGGRTVNLANEVKLREDGCIDVFRPCPLVVNLKSEYDSTELVNGSHKFILDVYSENIEYNGAAKAATNEMRKLTGLPYGWGRIWDIAKRKLLILRWFYKPRVEDEEDNGVYPVCSTAVAAAVRKHYTDLVHLRPDQNTSPSDLARSPLLNYLFTIIKN